jgi:hypothetical protein
VSGSVADAGSATVSGGFDGRQAGKNREKITGNPIAAILPCFNRDGATCPALSRSGAILAPASRDFVALNIRLNDVKWFEINRMWALMKALCFSQSV